MPVRFIESDPFPRRNSELTNANSETKRNSDDDSVQLLQNPSPLQEFEKNFEDRVIESTLAACVFRKHLKLAKNEEETLLPLQKICTLSDKSESRHDLLDSHDNSENQEIKHANSNFELPDAYFENAISFEDVIAQSRVTQVGEILLCTNVTLPVLSHVNGTYHWNTVVQDPCTGKVCRLEIVCSDFNEANLLVTWCKYPYMYNVAPNSVVLLRDPTFKIDSSRETLSICVDKVYKVVFLRQGSILPKPGIHEEIPSENSNDGEADHGSESSGEKSKASLLLPSSTCEDKYARDEWKEWGDEHAIRKRIHFKAFLAYDIALRFSPDKDVDLRAAKCASLINLGLFLAALKEVDRGIDSDPYNSGLITRKVHCLWGQGKYNEAMEYLKGYYKELQMSAEQSLDDEIGRKLLFLQKSICKTENFLIQQENVEIFNNEAYYKWPVQMYHFEPDYARRITLKNVENNEGSRKKIAVVNQSVPAGTLLAKTKAFAAVFQTDDTKDMSNHYEDDELINLILQKLAIENPDLCNLFGAAADTTKPEASRTFSKKEVAVNLCEKHMYSMSYQSQNTILKNEVGDQLSQAVTSIQIKGIWTFPAFIRHACVGGNAVWCICGNIMFIRSICPINEGEEVVMALVEPTNAFEFRTKFLKQRGIECSCPLCHFERNEPDSIKEKRNEIMQTISSNFLNEPECFDVRQLVMRLQDLETLRSAFPKLNFPIVEPLYKTGLHLMRLKSYKEAICAFEKAFYVVDNTTSLETLVNLCILLSYCYMAKKNSDRNRSKNWFNSSKMHAKLYYGSLSPVQHKFKAEFEYLRNKGIVF